MKLAIDRRMVVPKVFYLFFYGSMAALSPFLTLHYQDVGLTGSQIGVLIGLVPLVRLLGGPLWSAVADVTQRHKLMLLTTMSLTAICVYGISQATTFVGLMAASVAMAFAVAPIDALVDSAVLDMLGSRREAYGQQRLWGAVGWGLAAPLVGQMAELYSPAWHFYGLYILMALSMPLAWRLQMAPMARRVSFWRGLGGMVRTRWWALFLITVFIASVGRSASFGFMNLHLDDLGASRLLIGMAVTVAGFSEIPTFFYSGMLLRRWGARVLVLLALGTSLIMLLGFGWVTTPSVLVLLQVFHGPAFAAIYVAGVYYAGLAAPPGLEATTRAMYGAVGALAMTIGGFVGGYLYDTVGALVLFRLAALLVAVATAFYLFTHRPETEGAGDA